MCVCACGGVGGGGGGGCRWEREREREREREKSCGQVRRCFPKQTGKRQNETLVYSKRPRNVCVDREGGGQMCIRIYTHT